MSSQASRGSPDAERTVAVVVKPSVWGTADPDTSAPRSNVPYAAWIPFSRPGSSPPSTGQTTPVETVAP